MLQNGSSIAHCRNDISDNGCRTEAKNTTTYPKIPNKNTSANGNGNTCGDNLQKSNGVRHVEEVSVEKPFLTITSQEKTKFNYGHQDDDSSQRQPHPIAVIGPPASVVKNIVENFEKSGPFAKNTISKESRSAKNLTVGKEVNCEQKPKIYSTANSISEVARKSTTETRRILDDLTNATGKETLWEVEHNQPKVKKPNFEQGMPAMWKKLLRHESIPKDEEEGEEPVYLVRLSVL